jgi:hypothetical protein
VTPLGVAQLSGGTLMGLLPGTAHITAVAGPLTGTLDVRVIATEGLEVTPSTVERLPGGNGFFTVTGATSSVSWTVNGIAGGNATYGTIDVEGFYQAPASVPSLSTFEVCAVQASPPLQGCSHVTIRAIPSAGADLIVINDVNAMENGSIGFADNVAFFKNVVGFTPVGARASATRVVFQYGHASQCGLNLCSPASTSELRTAITAAGVTGIIDDNSDVGVIPGDVRVVFLMTPTTAYSIAEVNNLKNFAAGGGRIVFIGENSGYYVGTQVERSLFFQLGSQVSDSNGLVNCANFDVDAAHIFPHQTTVGVSSLYVPCASALALGPNDYAIARGQVGSSSGFLPIIASVKIDVTPISQSGGSRARTSVRPAPIVAPTPPIVRDTTGFGPRGKPPQQH